MKERLNYLDGIRGIACLLVFAYHYHAFFGNSFWGLDFLADKLDIVYNGAYYVRFFFMISAFLMAVSIYRLVTVEKLRDQVIKRYLRLALPVMGVCVLIWIMEQAGAFHNQELAALTEDPDILKSFQTKHHFYEIFTTSMIRTIFAGECSFNNNFWMMTVMFWGDLIAMVTALLTRNRRKSSKWIFTILILFCLILNNNYLPFVLGSMIAYWYTSEKHEQKRNEVSVDKATSGMKDVKQRKIFSVAGWTCLLLAGVVLLEAKGYIDIVVAKLPIQNVPELQFLYNGNFYNALSLVMVFLAVIKLKWIQKILSLKIFTSLGKISYYVFLIHWPMVCSLSAGLYLLWYQGSNYATIVRSIFGITCVCVIIIAWILNITYEKLCGKVTTKVLKCIEEQKGE